MKRRTWIFILVSLLLISLVACSNNGSSNVDDTTDTLAALQQDTMNRRLRQDYLQNNV